MYQKEKVSKRIGRENRFPRRRICTSSVMHSSRTPRRITTLPQEQVEPFSPKCSILNLSVLSSLKNSLSHPVTFCLTTSLFCYHAYICPSLFTLSQWYALCLFSVVNVSCALCCVPWIPLSTSPGFMPSDPTKTLKQTRP